MLTAHYTNIYKRLMTCYGRKSVGYKRPAANVSHCPNRSRSSSDITEYGYRYLLATSAVSLPPVARMASSADVCCR